MPTLTADQIQAPDDAARQLAEKRERKIREAVLAALLGLSGFLASEAVILLIQRLDAQGVANVFDSDEATRTLIAGYQPIADTFDAAARGAANDNFSGLITYDPIAAAATQAAMRDAFLQAIRSSLRASIQAVLLDAVRRGTDADSAAELLQAVIGLTPQQAKAVLNYRRLLTAGDPGALERALRDRRFDATVQAMLRGERALSEDQVQTMVTRYAERMLRHRAETIARTESMQAAVGGIRQAYKQAVDSGQLLDSEVRRFWLTAADERVCPICSSVPALNPKGVGVDEPYKTLEGPKSGPLLHPRCRCSERFVADLGRLQHQPFYATAA